MRPERTRTETVLSDQENRGASEDLENGGTPPREVRLDLADDSDTTRAAELDERADPADEADAADAAEESGPRRPPLIVIIGSALLLVAIGVGLGSLIPSGPAREELLPTATAVDPAAVVPTALPLPEAVGTADSTEPIARVGDAEIPRGDFVRMYQPGADPQELLDQLILRELVVQAATSEGVEVDDAAVTAQVDQLKLNQAGGDDAQFATFLTDNGIGTEENLRRLIGRDLLIEQMVLRHTVAEQVRARHILLSATPEEAEARKAEAEELLAEIEGGGDFAALAQEKSDDPGSKENGGELGWAPRGAYVGPFDEAVFSMEVGEVRLVQTDFGWHIIEVLEAPQERAFESLDLLNTQTGQQAFQESFLPWADQLKADAEAAGEVEVLVEASELVTDPAQS